MDSSQAGFDIIYEGPAVADGSMNVRHLAPAMLAVGTLFEAANNITNGQRAKVNINVKATSPGSFHILYEVIQATIAQGLDPTLLTTAVQLKELLIGGVVVTGSLIAIIKWVNRRKPKLNKINDELYTLVIDNESYELPLQLLRFYQDASIRHALADIIQPVKEEGIDRVRILDNKQPIQEITKHETSAFDIPEMREPLLDEVRRHGFSIIGLSFKEDNKWRLTDGENTFSVSMKDVAFQRRVDNNQEAFAKGDVLICDLRTVQWQVEGGIKTEYEVVKVVNHRPARQLVLFTENEGLPLLNQPDSQPPQ
jgi:hypothetical protein